MTEVTKTIVRAAMRDATVAHANFVEDETWRAIESLGRAEQIETVRFAYDTGIVSLDYKFVETDNQALARLLWNEFADDIVDPDRGDKTVAPEDIKKWIKTQKFPKWKRELVETPRVVKPDELAWHDKRIKRANLPLTVSRLQVGEIYGGEVEWTEIYRDVDLEWGTSDNGEVGILTGSECIQGWDEDKCIYLRHDDTLENNETAYRIAL